MEEAIYRKVPKKVHQFLQLATLDFEQVEDTRALRSKDQLPLWAILTVLVVCLASKVKTPRAMEEEISRLRPKTRRRLGFRKRATLSDTCIYENLARTKGSGCRFAVGAQVKDALARKQVQNDVFAGGVMSFDGKKTAHGTKLTPEGEVMRTFWGKKAKEGWMFYTVRACLTSSSARPIVDQEVLHNRKGESTGFKDIFPRVYQMFPRLFRYVTADAAYTSKENALLLRAVDKHYVFAVKDNQRALLKKAIRDVAAVPYEITASERYNGWDIVRQIRRVKVSPDVTFPGATQFVHVHQRKTRRSTGEVTEEDRYYILSIPWDEMSLTRLAKLIRLHWGIENGANWTCDVMFEEDTHFPCRKGYGPHLMSWLLILAYNLVAIYRSLGPKLDQKRKSFAQVFKEIWAIVFASSYADLSLEHLHI